MLATIERVSYCETRCDKARSAALTYNPFHATRGAG
jgi:hypothetical protein